MAPRLNINLRVRFSGAVLGNYWFKFDYKSYDEKTNDLSILEHGAYLRLLIHYYRTDSALPNDNERLARICRAHSDDELRAIAAVITRYFELKNDGWHNKRADEELKQRRAISNIRSNAALSKCRAKAQQLHSNSSAKPEHKHTQITDNTIQKEESKSKAAASAFQIPAWIARKEWDEYEEMRRKLRKPMTDKARSLIAEKLFKLRSAGNDPTQVLEQSIRNSWQDVFALKGGPDGTNRQATEQPKRQPSAQVERWNNNRTERERARAAVVGSAGSNGNGSSAGLGAGNSLVLDGQIKKLP